MRHIVISALLLSVSACSVVPTLPGVTPHRIEIQQGNYISQEMVAQLKPGMSREQVRFALGTPLVTDIFHADRWDYVYYRDVPNKPRERRRLAVFFEDGKLARLDGDVMPGAPAEAPAAKPAAATPPKPATEAAQPPAAEATKPAAANAVAETEDSDASQGERGFFRRMIDRIRGSQ